MMVVVAVLVVVAAAVAVAAAAVGVARTGAVACLVLWRGSRVGVRIRGLVG